MNLIGPVNALGFPAPYWFLLLFKVLGFILHLIPMSLFYAGLPLAIVLHRRRDLPAQQLAARLARQMPFLVAWGVNLGIVPLLFTQVIYYQVFYPATILMAWPWFSIIPLLTLAYYGVYVYASGFRAGKTLTPVKKFAGVLAAVIFVAISFLFTSAFTLMANVGAWPDLWLKTSVAGAPLGLAHSLGDPILWPRWLMTFGLALTTTAAYLLVDTGMFAREKSGIDRRGAARLAFNVYTVGGVWYVVTGAWYLWGTWPEGLRSQMLSPPWLMLTGLTALSPLLPWILALFQARHTEPCRRLALFIGLGQFLVLTLNACSRQLKQNFELARYLDVSSQPVHLQWSPMMLFLVLFVAGLGLVVWMVVKVLEAFRRPATSL